MISISSIVLFISSSWLLILSPGPDSIYVLTRGISLGRKAGVISAVGVTLGIFVHTIFAALGISVILMTSSILFSIVKIIGSVYLVYIGIRTIMDKRKIVMNSSEISEMQGTNSATNTGIFLQGILSNTLNPKVALFFIAYLPQFVNKNSSSASLQMVILGATFAFFGALYLVSLGYFSGRIGRWIAKKDFIMNRIRITSGSILIALGIKLAFVQQSK